MFDCPLPKFDFDIITLGHGSGGVLTNRLLEQGIFSILSNPLLDQKHDGAIFELEGKVAFSTDSFVINPIFFPGGDIGELAVNGTVNDLSMCGAIPRYLSLSFIIEEGLPVTDLWTILNSIRRAADAAGVSVVTGDTKVVEKGKGDRIFINTTGIGVIHPSANISLSRVKHGDSIIVSHRIATHGIAIMSVREGLEFETSVLSDTTCLNHMVSRLLDLFGHNIHLLKDPTRGGLASILNEIARDTGLGVDLAEQSIPVEDQVFAACELLGLDPLYVANEGVFIAVVDPSVADDVVRFLSGFERAAAASFIGQMTDEHTGQVVIKSRIGGRRVVNMLAGEQLPRIC